MQYSAIFLAVLAATGAVASPTLRDRSAADNKVRVILSDYHHKPSKTVFYEAPRSEGHPKRSGPFKKVELKLGDGVQNKDLRCQILDEEQKPIVVQRGGSTEITFADGGKGAWTLRDPSKVSRVVCDEGFEKLGDDANEIRVVLSNQSIELGIQNVFTPGQREEQAIATSDPFETVELRLGELVDPAYRCQIVDKAHQPITVIRGDSVAETFGDGGKGEWTLQEPTPVGKIICDPAFEK